MTPECWRYSDGCISEKPQHFAWPEYMPEKTQQTLQIQNRPSHTQSQKLGLNVFLMILESFWFKGFRILDLNKNILCPINCACSSVRCRRHFCDWYYEVDNFIWACVRLRERVWEITVRSVVTLRKASFCSRCLLMRGRTWSISAEDPSLSWAPHQSSSRRYSCSRLSSTLHTCESAISMHRVCEDCVC